MAYTLIRSHAILKKYFNIETTRKNKLQRHSILMKHLSKIGLHADDHARRHSFFCRNNKTDA